MAEIQPAEGQINGGGTLILNSTEPIGTKRQRRPSVRLGDIGVDPPYDTHARRNNKSWKLSFDHQRKDKDSIASAGRLKNQRREVLLLLRELDRIGFQELMKPVVVLLRKNIVVLKMWMMGIENLMWKIPKVL